MSIRNRELSQFGSFVHIDDPTRGIGITTESTPYVGIGTTNPQAKFEVYGNTNIKGNLGVTSTVVATAVSATSYTLNGVPLIDAALETWKYASNGTDIFKLNGNVGLGTSTITQKFTVVGNVSAGQFISTVSSGTPPLVVSSDTQVTNLNASFLRGQVPPTGSIVGTTDSQTITNKIISSSSIPSSGIAFSGSTSGSTILSAGSTASGTLTLPSATDTLIGKQTTDILTNKTISASSNTITGLTNSNLSGSAGITNANLQNSTISGVSLGSTLSSLSFGSYLNSSGDYNGSTARTISVGATSANTGNTIVARDASGDFSAADISCSSLTASFNVSASTVSAGGTITAAYFVGDGSQLTNAISKARLYYASNSY